jgi:type IV pilus biogenesis protein CpaD/CtpE
MRHIDRLSTGRFLIALIASGLVAAGCANHDSSASFIDRADRALTAKVPPDTSPYVRYPSTRCPEWRKFLGHRRINGDKWKFGCVDSASLVVSVSNKRDLRGGRRLRPSQAWEAVKTHADDKAGKLDPGQVDTSKSSTTSSTK